MMIRTRLSIAVIAATLSLVGCVGDDEDQQVVTESYVGFDPVVASADNAHLPANQQRGPVIPFPFDALFAGAKTPTLNIPNAGNIPFVANANMQDGFSTTASWFIDIFGMVDMATVPANVLILNSATGQPLVYKTDFDIQVSTVKDSSGIPINLQRTRLLIEPLKPLSPSTTYIVVLKKGIKTTNGGIVQPSYMFNLLNSDTKITDRTDSYLTRFSATEKANLEALRSLLVRKTVNTLKAIPPLGVTDTNVLLAYSITTQSINKTLDAVAAATTAQAIAVAPTGKTPHDINAALPANADIYLGTLKVPYYMATPADATVANPTPTLKTYWKADATKPDLTAKATAFQIPCGAYASGATLPDGQIAAPSVSTTTCFPIPVKQSDQTIPVLVTVPKTAKPAGGWPVAIFQHGITRNRSDMLAVAPALAQAGFVVVAIDLPLHGIAPAAIATNPLYKNQAFTGSPAAGLIANERTFDVDFVNNATNAAGPDGVVDGSGTHFINLASVITSRDNLRQGAADIIVLAKSLANLDIDGGGADIDMTKVRFVSQSLGSIVGTVALGIDKGATKTIGAASLSVGGGGIPKLLDASKSYGPVIAGGLAANGVLENTDSYETFMRFAQTLADSGDPINYAASAYSNHPLHVTEVLNDLVVPNKAMAGPASATQDFVGISALLSGTDALARVMGFAATDKKELDMATLTKSNAVGSTWVQFNQGAHGSLLNPAHPKGDAATAEEKATFLAITTEMQCQTASFLATSGAVVQVGCSLPVAP